LTTRPIQFLGRISYALYLIHWLVLYSIAVPLVLWLKNERGINSEMAWTIGCTACFVSGIALAWAGTIWIDEPAIRMSKRFANRVLGSTPRAQARRPAEEATRTGEPVAQAGDV